MKAMNATIWTAVLALLLGAGFAPARAGEPKEKEKIKQDQKKVPGAVKEDYPACAEEIRIHCSRIVRGYGRLAGCLRENGDEWLSKRCLASLPKSGDAPQKETASWRKACGADIERLCKDSAQSESLQDCMRLHWSKTSAACRNFATKKPKSEKGGSGGGPSKKK